MKLVFESIDPDTNCYLSRHVVCLGSLAAVSKILDLQNPEELMSHIFDLETREVRELIKLPEFDGIEVSKMARIRPYNPMDSLPYESHTGKELKMMLDGGKPLAHFSYLDGEDEKQIIDQPFEKHVAAGQIVHQTHILQGDKKREDWQSRDQHYIFYTLPGEEWRASEMWELVKAMSDGKWSADLERREGELLGYTDDQNAYYLEYLYENKFTVKPR